MAFLFNPDPSAPVENLGKMRLMTHEYDRIELFRLQNPQAYDCSIFDHNDHLGPMRAYNNCGVLHTVVSRNCQAMGQGIWTIRDYPDTTGEDITDKFKTCLKLFERPNSEQVWGEFIQQCELYRQLYGRVFIYASIPEGMSIEHVTELWVLPFAHRRNCADGWEWEIQFNGHSLRCHCDSIIEIRDSGIECSPMHKAYKDAYLWDYHNSSRYHSARYAIKNIIQAEQAIYEINRDRGAMGILSPETVSSNMVASMTPVEKETLLERLRRAFGISGGKHKFDIANQPMKWTPLTMNVAELMLIEGMDKNLETICNVFDYPKEMLVSDAKYSNKEASKSYYDDSIIPFSKIYASKLQSWLIKDAAYIVVDFSHIAAMKVAEETKARVFAQKAAAVEKMYRLGVLGITEARAELGYGKQIEGQVYGQEE